MVEGGMVHLQAKIKNKKDKEESKPEKKPGNGAINN